MKCEVCNRVRLCGMPEECKEIENYGPLKFLKYYECGWNHIELPQDILDEDDDEISQGK